MRQLEDREVATFAGQIEAHFRATLTDEVMLEGEFPQRLNYLPCSATIRHIDYDEEGNHPTVFCFIEVSYTVCQQLFVDGGYRTGIRLFGAVEIPVSHDRILGLAAVDLVESLVRV